MPRLRRQRAQRDLGHQRTDGPQQLTPLQAGFNGAQGIRLNNPAMGSDGGIYRLRRGAKSPSNYPGVDFTRQLIWHEPPGQQPRLLWCNDSNQWFELSFKPITKP